METVARYHKTEDAYLFRAYLESEGISAYVFDENVPQLFWHYTIAVGGVRVVVAPEDADAAAAFYKEYDQTLAAEPQAVGDVKYWPLALLVTLIVSVPFIAFGRKPPQPETGKP